MKVRKDFIAFDLKTTGLDPKTDRIIAAGAKTGEETAILTASTEGEIVRDFFSFLDDREGGNRCRLLFRRL